MKFGENIDKLSIPDWKIHNIQYNDIKNLIQLLSHTANSVSSSESGVSTANQSQPNGSRRRNRVSTLQLISAVKEQIDEVSLFIKLKKGEYDRKLNRYQTRFADFLRSAGEMSLTDQQRYKQSILNDLRGLSVEVRKLCRFITVQKIAMRKIKKKYTKNIDDPTKQFISSINEYLESSEDSFVNMDMTSLSLEATFLLGLIRDDSSKIAGEEQTRDDDDVTNIKSDMNNIVKTSFTKNFLIDKSNLNELKLNMSINFRLTNDEIRLFRTSSLRNLRETGQVASPKKSFRQPESILSYLYLLDVNNATVPASIIITELGSSESIILSHVGGLRKWAYCKMANSKVEEFMTQMKQLNFIRDEEELNQKKQQIDKYISFDNHFDGLTKMTLSWIFKKNLVPRFRKIFKRLRYSMYPDDLSLSDEDPSFSNQQDYYIVLDSDIMSTNKDLNVNFNALSNGSVDEVYKMFPYSNLAISYNNNVSQFPSKIDNLINSKSNMENNYLRELPLFNWVNFLKSYYLKIDIDEFNNYKNLLALNLLKENESLPKATTSYKSHSLYESQRHPPTLSTASASSQLGESRPLLPRTKSQTSYNTIESSNISTSQPGRYWSEYDIEVEEEGNWFVNYDIHEAQYSGGFINSCINLNNRLKGRFNIKTNRKLSYKDYLTTPVDENNDYTYYEADYDEVLTIVYFTFFFISLLCLGILGGVVYGALNNEAGNLIRQSPLLGFIVCLMALFESVMTFLALYCLNYRYQDPPMWHYSVVFGGGILIALGSLVMAIIGFT